MFRSEILTSCQEVQLRASQAEGEVEEASSRSSSLNYKLERLQNEVARANRAEKEGKERLEVGGLHADTLLEGGVNW